MGVSKADFEAAVKDAEAMLRAHLKSGLSEGDMAFNAALNRAIYNPTRAVEAANAEAEAHDALRLACAHELENGAELAAPIRAWLARYLKGEAPKPKGKRGRKPHTLQGRAGGVIKPIAYGMTAQMLVAKHGLNWSRGEGRDSEPRSAADAIAAALVRMGMGESEEGGRGGAKPFVTVDRALTDFRKMMR